MQETWFNLWVWKIAWKRDWQPTPVFLPAEFHGQRSLVGYSLWGCKESDTIKWLMLWWFLIYSVFVFTYLFSHAACGILHSTVKAQSPNHWTTKKFSILDTSALSDVSLASIFFFFLVCGLSSPSLNGVFWRIEVFIFDKIQFIQSFSYGLCFWFYS